MSSNGTRNDDSIQPGMASRQDAPDSRRRIQRRIMLVLPKVQRFVRDAGDAFREWRGGPWVVEFFHEVTDPYSELALQAAAELEDRYDVEFRFHLCSRAEKLFAPEPEMLADYARYDCSLIAPRYGLAFPKDAPPAPPTERVRRVESILATLRNDPRFLEIAITAGRALWSGDDAALDLLAEKVPAASEAETDAALEEGGRIRKQGRHYSGAMFRYGREWFWGVDRLHHLERRLARAGARRAGQPDAIRFDRPPLDPGTERNDGRLRLEIYPSLRSPYTAFIFDRSIELAERVGIPVEIKPVMPMVMRGVPAPGAKAIYIMTDAIREADHIGAPFGDMYDPIGRPVERGFSLWPFARDAGRGAEYLSSFLRAAFAEGRKTGDDEGLRFVVERAGLDWAEAKQHVDNDDWRPELEKNRQTMYDALGVWGVPSYRLLDAEGDTLLRVWGADRLWLVAAFIRERLAR